MKGTNTIRFIYPNKVINDKIICVSYVCDYRPLKDKLYRVQITVGGDKLDYIDDISLPVVNLLEIKILINSTISDAKKGARFICTNVKDYFLATPM